MCDWKVNVLEVGPFRAVPCLLFLSHPPRTCLSEFNEDEKCSYENMKQHLMLIHTRGWKQFHAR